ncbi:hypothetical protein GQ600_10161 [Phytophthora cactorum]|nr:hypothetical protein GQ600_10161 [Phytophthora cactorum]
MSWRNELRHASYSIGAHCYGRDVLVVKGCLDPEFGTLIERSRMLTTRSAVCLSCVGTPDVKPIAKVAQARRARGSPSFLLSFIMAERDSPLPVDTTAKPMPCLQLPM